MTQSRYSLMSEAYRSMYEGKRGLWDNIHAKRKRGEKPAKPGDKDYPKTLNVEATGDVTGHGSRLDTAYHYDMEDDGVKSGDIKNRKIKYGKKKKFRAEGLEQARKNVGADTCWDGYKAKGTKMKGGKSVPNCVKEDYINYLINHRFAIDEASAEAMYDHMSDKWKMMIEDRIEEGVLDAALKSDKKMGKLMKDTDKDVERVRKGGKFNYGDKNEEMSVKDQMNFMKKHYEKNPPKDWKPGDREKQRAAQMKSASERAPKNTRTDAERMADATGPRKGSNYRGD